MDICRNNNLDSELSILAGDLEFNSDMEELMTFISKDSTFIALLIKSIDQESDSNLDWVLPYLICIMNASPVIVPQLLDYLVLDYMLGAPLLEKMADLFNFCARWEYVKMEFMFEVTNAGMHLLEIYKMGILKNELCSKECANNWFSVFHTDLMKVIELDFSLGFSLVNQKPITSTNIKLLKILEQANYTDYLLVLGSIIIILAQISILKQTNEFEYLFNQIFTFIEQSGDKNIDTLVNSFKKSMINFVDVWWHSFTMPKIIQYLEKCLILFGNDADTVSEIFKMILTHKRLSQIQNLGKKGLHNFLSSWMHIICTFECKFKGLLSDTINEVLQNLEGKEANELSALFAGLHLTYIYESRYNLHIILDIMEIHDNWKKIFLFGNHSNLQLCKIAIDFVLEALPKKRFSIGMIYSILQSSLKRVFELCLSPFENTMLHDMIQQSFISLVVLLNKEYQTVDVIVDFVMDSYYFVFNNKEFISRNTILASTAACRLLFLPILSNYKVYDANGNECSLRPSMISSHVSRKILHYIPRDISRAKRIQNEPEIMYVFEKIPIVWELYQLSCNDASSHGYILSIIQNQASILSSWWKTPSKSSDIATNFPHQLYSTESIFSIYSMTNSIEEPYNSVKMLIPFLKGHEICTLMSAYCGYIESRFDLLEIGEQSEWLQHRLISPLESIVRDAFDEGRIDEDMACFFLQSFVQKPSILDRSDRDS